MRMKVYIEKDDKFIDVKIGKSKKISGKQLLNKIKINPSAIILVKDDEVVLDDETLEDDNEIKILSVVSGG
jgi:sulfur carrier protein ThiS